MVHLPIGIFFLAFVFECLSVSKEYRGLKKAVSPALLWGSVFAIAAAITGYFLRQEGGYDEKLADLHQNLGIVTAVLSLCVYVARKRVKYWIPKASRRKRVRILLFVPLIVLLSLTGHFGGSLTHGSDYLSAAFSSGTGQPRDPATRIGAIAAIPEAIFYADVIQPILDARCYDCHSASRKKGDLRLDEAALILRGGEDGPVIRSGPADSSALFHRLMLPIEDDDHMPPREKPQLSSSEIALIKYWLEEGAHFEKAIRAFDNRDKIEAIVRSFRQAPTESWIPADPVASADEERLQTIGAMGVAVMPLAEGNPYLMANFTGSRTVAPDQLKALLAIRDQLVWLSLSNSAISDADIGTLSGLTNLRVLYLNNTAVSDAGLEQIGQLTRLRVLSLVGTRVSDRSIATLEKFKKLNKLFVFQSHLTPTAIAEFSQRHPAVELDTGNYTLEVRVTDTLVYKRISSGK